MTPKRLAEVKAWSDMALQMASSDARALIHDHELLLAVATAVGSIMPSVEAFLASVPPSVNLDGVFMWAQSSSTSSIAPRVSAAMLVRLAIALRACGLGDADVTAPAEGEG
jgi:hypothetical protein